MIALFKNRLPAWLCLLIGSIAFLYFFNQLIAFPDKSEDYGSWLGSNYFIGDQVLALMSPLIGMIAGMTAGARTPKEKNELGFLIQRPVSKFSIFLWKTLPGLVIYIVVAGGWMVGQSIWRSLPGHYAAPYHLALPWSDYLSLYFIMGSFFSFLAIAALPEERKTFGAVAYYLFFGLIMYACIFINSASISLLRMLEYVKGIFMPSVGDELLAITLLVLVAFYAAYRATIDRGDLSYAPLATKLSLGLLFAILIAGALFTLLTGVRLASIITIGLDR